ncbi:transposase [Nocardiopsis mwathae]|uniref:Transposase n=1 Tax=Nocardiopsis mwathae TaxID=1472723 RepID=A0A7W9YL95_9ACTN|nr:ISL3 family transposase [Nocardiopsis mwathae]MBB6174250.1 transposase [Nocardiopsis mwathae]
MVLPDPPAPTPRVLGVDDFALLRGHIYGTILVDCDTGAPIELLDGREAEPLASWLRDHPGVEVICRDRSGAYAEAARSGAPQARQVADRFHLWQNLGKAVERCVAEHRSCLREPAVQVDDQPEAPEADEAPEAAPGDTEPRGRFADRTRTRHALVHELLNQGNSLRGISIQLGWSRHTVQPYARAATWEEMVDGKWEQPRSTKLDAFKPYLHQRVEEGCTNAARLHREITERGCRGSYSIVRDYLGPSCTEPAPAPPPPPTVRQVTGWLTRHPATLDQDEKLKLKAILEHCPQLHTTADQVRRFGEMLTELRGQELPAWIASVQEEGLSGLRGFASGVEADFDAVQQGLTSDHNSGAVEGRVNHLKTVKRQMYGRAGLPLLRKRVLLTASR